MNNREDYHEHICMLVVKQPISIRIIKLVQRYKGNDELKLPIVIKTGGVLVSY